MLILGVDLLEQLCEKLGFNCSLTRRIVLDVKFDAVPIVYHESYGTDSLLDIEMESDGIKIVEVGKSNQELEGE